MNFSLSIIRKIRLNTIFLNAIFFVTLLLSSYGVFLLTKRVFDHPSFLQRMIATLFYFTTQSNLIVFVVLVLFLFRLKDRKWYQVLSFIALIDIIITAVVFHAFLKSHIPEMNIIQSVLHTFIPLAYTLFYFIVLVHKPGPKDYLFALLHPLIFLLLVYLIVRPFFSETMTYIFPDFSDSRYVYPFLNPNNYQMGIIGLLLFLFAFLTPMITLISYLLQLLKLKIENLLQ